MDRTFYIVATSFANLEFASPTDSAPDFEDAISDYVRLLAAGYFKARVYRIEMGENRMPTAIIDLTKESDAIIAQRKRETA